MKRDNKIKVCRILAVVFLFLDYIRCEGIGTERYVHFG